MQPRRPTVGTSSSWDPLSCCEGLLVKPMGNTGGLVRTFAQTDTSEHTLFAGRPSLTPPRSVCGGHDGLGLVRAEPNAVRLAPPRPIPRTCPHREGPVHEVSAIKKILGSLGKSKRLGKIQRGICPDHLPDRRDRQIEKENRIECRDSSDPPWGQTRPAAVELKSGRRENVSEVPWSMHFPSRLAGRRHRRDRIPHDLIWVGDGKKTIRAGGRNPPG